MAFDTDVLIVGSGFGGAVSALRLSQKGYTVQVFEQGLAVGKAEIAEAKTSRRKLLWQPARGRKGFLAHWAFPQVTVVGGVGVGGGSLVSGAVLLEPDEQFFNDPAWAPLSADWQAELAPHYTMARRMLGLATNTRLTVQDELLRQTAVAMGAEASFGPTPVAIYFGEPGKTSPDPYFGGHGPERMGCIYCGGCLSGCPQGSKNSLDYNYLHHAAKRGARIHAERQVTRITPLTHGGYAVESRHPFTGKAYSIVTTQKLVLAAGVVGSLKLLFENRDRYGTLPQLSPKLGAQVRRNGEVSVAILHKDPEARLMDGVASSSQFNLGSDTHLTQNRDPVNFGFQRLQLGPLVDGTRPWWRAVQVLIQLLLPPWAGWQTVFASHWQQRISVLRVTQDHDYPLRFGYRRSRLLFWRKAFTTELKAAARAPSFLPAANAAARAFAEAADGLPLNLLRESLNNRSTTNNLLGGAVMGQGSEQGVIDSRHEVHGYPGLFVVDGSAVSARLGVHPSLTIAALAERFASLWPPKTA